MKEKSIYRGRQGLRLDSNGGTYIKGEKSDEGYMYKDPDGYFDGWRVCYASERQLSELEDEYDERDSFIMESAIVDMGLAESCHTIRAKVRDSLSAEVLDLPGSDVIVMVIADLVFTDADGRDIDDVILNYNVDGIIEGFVENSRSN